MHQYGEEAFCLIWAVNNALQEKIVKKGDGKSPKRQKAYPEKTL
jgi:hypothetical protein